MLAAILLAFVSASINAWVLLVEIKREEPRKALTLVAGESPHVAMTDLWPGIATSRRPVEARLPLALPPDVSPITAAGARVQELAGSHYVFPWLR